MPNQSRRRCCRGVIGCTPFIQLKKIEENDIVKCKVFAKCEFMNPGGSTEDRKMCHLLNKRTMKRMEKTGSVLVTEGPPDFCLSAAIAASRRGLRHVVVPTCHIDPTSALALRIEEFGGYLVNIDTESQVTRKAKIKEIMQKMEPSAHLKHCVSPQSIERHYNGTAREIHNKLHGHPPQMVVCGGEGAGMVYALGMKLRDGKSTKVIGIDFSVNQFGDTINSKELHLPKWQTYSTNLPKDRVEMGKVDIWGTVNDTRAYEMARRLMREEGLLVGPKSGAVVAAAISAIRKYGLDFDPEAVVVVVLNDKYDPTEGRFIFPHWLQDNKYFTSQELESLIWWWEMPVTDIQFVAPLVLPLDTTGQEALDAMNDCSIYNAVVVSEAKLVQGILTKESLEYALESENFAPTDSVEKIMETDFLKVDAMSRLSDVVSVFFEVFWCLVVQLTEVYDEDAPEGRITESYIGLIHQGNFIAYTKRVEKHHMDNYQIALKS